jgi:hypothetical protein
MGASETKENTENENFPNANFENSQRKKTPPPEISTESPDLSRDIKWDHYSPESTLNSEPNIVPTKPKDDINIDYQRPPIFNSTLYTIATVCPNGSVAKLYKPLFDIDYKKLEKNLKHADLLPPTTGRGNGV